LKYIKRLNMIYINYDENTLRVLGAYGEEKNTPSPYIAVTIEDWKSINELDIKDVIIYVSDDLKSVYVDSSQLSERETAISIDTAQQEVENELQEILRQMAISKYIELNKVE